MKKLDILNREEFVDKLVNLTENISANRTSTSFAIDGPWGCGKTFVLDMYEKRLAEIQSEETSMDKYFVIRYNCWKYDYYEEPLIAIVAAMIDIVNHKAMLLNDEKKKARILGVLKAVGTTLLSMANDGIKEKFGIDVKTAYDAIQNDIEAESEKIEQSHEYDIYFSFNQVLNRLQELIADLSNGQTVIFIVDELDRCLPEYAIKVLERLHHLTENSNNVITLLSMDKTQLQMSIKHIFGFDETEKYLEKFIQFEIKLDCGEVSEQIIEKHSDYITLFNADLCPVNESIEEFLQMIFQDINVRTQEQIIKKVKIAHSLLFNEPQSTVFMCMELLLTVINDCYEGKLSFCKMIEQLSSTIYSNRNSPPFANFFNERFKELHYTETTHGIYNTTTYIFSHPKSLYLDVLYLWCNMFFPEKRMTVSLKDRQLKKILDENLEELKRFYETIKFIK